jgi:hypothetical protein
MLTLFLSFLNTHSLLFLPFSVLLSSVQNQLLVLAEMGYKLINYEQQASETDSYSHVDEVVAGFGDVEVETG